MKTIRYGLLSLLLVSASIANAQLTDRDYIRMGNRKFRGGELDKAVTNYQKALEKKRSSDAFYNLGCASVLMGQDSISISSFVEAENIGFSNPRRRAMNFHNLANVWYMYGLQRMRSNDKNSGQYIQNAVNLYKSALRCNPEDNETRYNLAMAQWVLSRMKGGNDDQQQKKEEEEKQKQEQERQKKEQQKKEQEQKDQMSDQAAEQLLKSAQQEEKDVQRKIQQQPARRRSLEKDW